MKSTNPLSKFSVVVLSCIICTFVTGIATAQITNTPNGYLLRMKFVAGQVLKYNIQTRTLAAKGKIGSNTLDVPTIMTITEVKEKIGTIKMEIGPALESGKPRGIKKFQELKMDDHGKVVSGLTPGLQSFKSVEYPDMPVKIGGSYRVSQEAAFQGQKMKVSSICTLIKVVRVGRREVAFFKIETSSTRIELPLQTSGITYLTAIGIGSLQLDTADGQILNMVMKQRAIFKPGPGAPKDLKDEELTNVLTASRSF